jgi:hypothetical protein
MPPPTSTVRDFGTTRAGELGPAPRSADWIRVAVASSGGTTESISLRVCPQRDRNALHQRVGGHRRVGGPAAPHDAGARRQRVGDGLVAHHPDDVRAALERLGADVPRGLAGRSWGLRSLGGVRVSHRGTAAGRRRWRTATRATVAIASSVTAAMSSSRAGVSQTTPSPRSWPALHMITRCQPGTPDPATRPRTEPARVAASVTTGGIGARSGVDSSRSCKTICGQRGWPLLDVAQGPLPAHGRRPIGARPPVSGAAR